MDNIHCPECGSGFSLLGNEASTHQHLGRQTIGHFELVEEVGLGAFGSVWKARDTDLKRTVAVKLPRYRQLTATESEQFLREARAAAQLRHPNIVAVHEIGREGDQVYIVSDFVDGVPLSSWLTAQRPSPREAATLCLKLAEALEHAHQSGVIHRDLKPANIMLENDEPRIMDFGLAKQEAGEVTITIDGRVLGTPAYMAPEQARGDGHLADRRSDVYALGVILFELLTGELPFRGDIRMLIHQVVNEDAPSPRKLNNRIPMDLETICAKCLQKRPEQRYDSALALADDLGCFLRCKPIRARRITVIEKGWRWCKRNAVVSALATSLILALTLGLALSVWQSERRRQLLYISDMRVVQQAWEQANVALAEDTRAGAFNFPVMPPSGRLRGI